MPTDVSRFEFNHHVAINCICYFVFLFLLVSSVLFFIMNEKYLLIVNAINLLCWVFILNYNLSLHKLCFLLMCGSIIISNYFFLITFGWDAGFQNYFVSLSVFILLHALISIAYLYSISFISISLYLVFYYSDIYVEKYTGSTMIDVVYFVNSLFSYLIVFASIVLLRVDVNGMLKNLSRTARTDRLTGLYNRYYMHKKLHKVFEASKRYKHKNALLLIDIDNFKFINDTFGHSTGDFVLKKLSKIFLQRLRKVDSISRWGGEEFLILMPFTAIEDAYNVSEVLRELVEQNDFSFEGNSIRASFTGGLVEIESDETIENALSRADKLLYKGKEQGRNMIVR